MQVLNDAIANKLWRDTRLFIDPAEDPTDSVKILMFIPQTLKSLEKCWNLFKTQYANIKIEHIRDISTRQVFDLINEVYDTKWDLEDALAKSGDEKTIFTPLHVLSSTFYLIRNIFLTL